MSKTTPIVIVKVTPITFGVTVNATNDQNVDTWCSDMRSRHPCVAYILPVDKFDVPGTRELVREVRIILDTDADYRQICALRAELKT